MAFSKIRESRRDYGRRLISGMMNHVMPLCPAFGLQHIAIRRTPPVWTLAAGGRQRQKAIGSEAQGHVTGLDYSEVSVAKSRKCNAAAAKRAGESS